MRVGFVGLGRMGLPMAVHVAAAGHEVIGHDTSEQAHERAAGAGLRVVPTLSALESVDIVCSSLPDTMHVQAVYSGQGGLFKHVSPGTVCVDLSTISVPASVALATQGADRDVMYLDAPVSGTSIHAEQGTLVVMVGGDETGYEAALPVLSTFSRSVHHVGPNGSGLRLKLVTNRLLTTHLTAIAEAVVELETLGLDVVGGLEIIRNGAVPKLLDYKAQPLADRDFAPQFTVDLMRKDLGHAAEESPPGRLAALSQTILEEAGAMGHGDDDLVALIAVVDAYMTSATKGGKT